MPKLVFRVASDWEEVVKLRNEIAKLKQELKGMDSTQSPVAFKTLNTQLAASTQQMDELVTNAAKAGAEMENGFKKKIFDASQSVNGFTEKILAQKAVVKDVEVDVKRLGESYRTALKNNPMSASGKLSEYTSAKKALDEEKAALFELTQKQANARLSVKKLRDEYALYKNEGKQVVETNNGIAVSWKKALAVIGGVSALKALGSEIIRVRGEFQSMQTAMETMVGKDVAGPLMAQVKELAKISPLTMTDMVGAEKMMLGFNIQAEDTIKYLKALSDISMGESSKFNSLTLAFSQMSAAGKLLGQDLNQMISAGFNPLQIMADKTGKSIATLKDEMSKGTISAKMVQQAFLDAASAGGKFYNMSENASKTINGQLSMMQDALDNVFNELGTKGEGIIMSGIQATTSLIQNYETVGKVLAGLVVTYGTYRTAVMLLTAAESKHTLVEIGLTNARILARKAQLALNAAMLTNPYVLLATAVVGLGAAMWAFHDATTAAEKAQKRFNEKQKEAAKQEQERKQKIDSLVESSRDIALADLQRGESLAELRKEYPKIFAKYDIESIKLADILKLKRQIADEDAKRAGKKKEKELSDIEAEIKYYENLLDSLSGQQGVDGYVKKLKELRDDRDIRLQEKGKGISEQFISSLKDIDITEFDRYISELEKRIKGKSENGKVKMRLPIGVEGVLSDEAIYDVKDIKNLIDTAKSSKQTRIDAEKNKTTYQEDLAKAKVDWEAAKKGYEALLKDQKATSEAVKKAKEDLDTKEKAYKDLGGVTDFSKLKTQAEQLQKQQESFKQLLNKQAVEQVRTAEDLENQTEQARINAMKEGNARTLEQMKLDHSKEMQQLKRQREDALLTIIENERAKFEADPQNKGKKFDASGIKLSGTQTANFDNQEAYIREKQANENKSYLDEQRHSWDEYLLEYSNFQEKKLALKRIYDDKIANATTAGEKASFKKEFETKDKELNLDEIKSSINFADIFGNLDSQSTDAIKTLRDKLKEIIEKSAKDLKPTDLKALQEALQGMDLKIAERDPFSELKNGLDNYKASCKDVETAQSTYNATLEKGWTIVSKYDEKTGKTTYSYISQKQALEGLIDAQRKKKESQMQLTQSINSIGEKGQQVVQAGNDLVDMLTNLGIKIPESVTGALSGVGQIMDGLANIDITKPMSIVTGVTGMLAGLGKTIGSIFGLDGDSNTKKHFEDLKEQLDGINKIYEKIIENSKEKITFGEGFAAITAAADAMDTLNKKLENYRSLVRAGIEYKDGTKENAGWHSNKNVGAENFAWMSKLVGKNITSVYDLANLGAEDLYTIMTKMPGAWGQMDEHVRTALEDIVACKDEAKELGDALGEAVTGISYDSFRDGFIDQLTDMDNSFEDMCDNFEDYLRKSILGAMVANGYKDRIQKLYDDWTEAGKDQTYTEQEISDLRKQKDDLIQDMINDRENAAAAFGWESSSSQEATKGSFQTMSQDAGTELNGRFTAFQASNEEIKNQSAIQSQSLNLLTAKADTILSVNTEVKNIADDTRDLIAQTYLELVQISENTGNSAKYLKDIKADIAEVKKNTSKL